MVVFKCNEAANERLIRLLVFGSERRDCVSNRGAKHSNHAPPPQDSKSVPVYLLSKVNKILRFYSVCQNKINVSLFGALENE